MAEEFESFEIEVSEEDIIYYIEDEEGNQVGFAVMEDGEEVEYYFDGDADMFELVDGSDELAEEVIELEFSEDDIIYRIVDENDVEIGFAIMEDGEEVEYYYEEVEIVEEPEPAETAAEETPEEPEGPVEHGYLYKMASIAGHRADKTRKKAEVKI
ncbi:MAG: hypothetical protein J5818_01285, partial [Eggerthellaceae bacterium]|nr:hypothetical protein [Eggerthellaceae bacterium]